MENPDRRFASNLSFIDPAAQKTSVLDGTGLMLGHPSLGNTFNESLFYTPQLVLKNTSKANQTATVTVRYTGNGKEGAKALPAVSLAPHEVRMVDFRKFVAGLKNISVKSAGLEVISTGGPGSIIAMLTSVDEAHSRAVDVPMVSRSERSGEGGNHPFRFDEEFQSVAYLTNITGKATKVMYVIFYEGGMFTPELVNVAPGETVAIDILQLRDSQVKDVQSRTLPTDLSKGQFFWHPHRGEALIGRVVTIDKRSGTASNFSCQNCCGMEPSRWEESPDPFSGPVGSSQGMTLYEYDSMCGQFTVGPYVASGVVGIYSDNTSVATVNSGTSMVNFVGPGNANIVWQIEYYHLEAISAEDCGLVLVPTEEPCPVTAVQVMFQKSDGSALPNPLQVGITATTLSGQVHNRKQHLRLVVTPSSEAANVSIEVSSKLQKSNVSRSGGIVTFDVVGTSKSTSHSDSTITARHMGNSVGTAAVEVIVPNNVSATHDTIGGGLVIQNRALNVTTSPALIDVPANQVALKTVYIRNLTITVCDQFGGLIGDLYQGAEISENSPLGVFSINQFLTASSTYTDPVGFSVGTTVVAVGSNQANNWPTQPKLPFPSGTFTDPQNISVFVDGFALNPAIANRTVTGTGNGFSSTSPPVTLTISWP